jgi:SAM-dependent methyltransferase
MAPRFIALQLSHPAGWLGVVVTQLMNRGNARINAFALEKLAPSSHDRILEVGFGGGLLLPELIARAALVCGVDTSDQALAAARSRFAKEIVQGWADFRQGRIEALPYDDRSFNKALTVNTVYFWKSLSAGFAEIGRVLVPGGRAVIGFLPKAFMDKMNMPTDIFTARSPEEVMAAMREAGFSDVKAERPNPETKWNVVVATRH